MRCLTCGKRINPQMTECPNCGAMNPRPQMPTKPAGPGGDGQTVDWKSVLSPRPSSAPPDVAVPEPVGAEPGEQAKPVAPPTWTQYIFPLILFIWIAYRMFGPEIRRFLSEPRQDQRGVTSEAPVAAPELQQLLLCSQVEAGQPLDVRDTFSMASDKQMTAFTTWGGLPGASRFEFNWHSPSGKVLTAQVKLYQPAGAERRFVVYSELPLGDFAALGIWRVDVLRNGESVASHDFSISR